jgi:uncharacterized protein (DUF952 family)/ribosomal protein S18 acetylase RimI-like enzyme
VRNAARVSDVLLHLVTTAQWRDAIAGGVVAPPSLAEVGFVHLSSPAQVHLPANRLLAGRADVWLLVLDPARIPAEIRWEAGVPTDPESMRFPHAYGPVPLAAVTSVLPYRPGPDGFAPPDVPGQDPDGRFTGLIPSLLRRAASAEEPVTGGVAVLTEPVPASYTHNQLLVDGAATVGQVAADADRVLGGAGLHHRRVRLSGAHLATTADALAARGWTVEPLVGMASPVGEPAHPRPDEPHAEQVERLRLAVTWANGYRRDYPGITDGEIAELRDRYRYEEAVADLRYLAVFDRAVPVASCVLKIDGATALIDMVATDPAHRGRGHGDTLLRTCRALAAAAGCDLLVLEALVQDWPRRWYTRLGFTELGPTWECTRVLPAT